MVEGKYVEPISLSRPLKADLLGLPHTIETLVSQGSHSVESHLGVTLFQENGRNLHLVNCVLTNKIVDKRRNRKQIQGSKEFGTITGWIVVVTVNRKDWEVCNEYV